MATDCSSLLLPSPPPPPPPRRGPLSTGGGGRGYRSFAAPAWRSTRRDEKRIPPSPLLRGRPKAGGRPRPGVANHGL
eukprot:9476001-Pyramimonas_sp.AAC.1